MSGDQGGEALFEVGNGVSLKGFKKIGKSRDTLGGLLECVTGEHHNRAELGPSADVEEDILAGVRADLLTHSLSIGLWTGGHKVLEGLIDAVSGLQRDDTVQPSYQVLRLTRKAVGINHKEVILGRGLRKVAHL